MNTLCALIIKQIIKRCFIFYWKMCLFVFMSASDKEGIQQGIQVNLLFFDVKD